MPRKDLYHNEVRRALEKDGWKITHDPMRFRWKKKTIFPDLGIEKVIAAERGLEKIAVEIKSFQGDVLLHEFYSAIGQYDIYKAALADLDVDRKVVLAIPLPVYRDFILSEFGQAIIEIKQIPIVVYDYENENIVIWLK
jgi:hypothetical protein